MLKAKAFENLEKLIPKNFKVIYALEKKIEDSSGFCLTWDYKTIYTKALTRSEAIGLIKILTSGWKGSYIVDAKEVK